MEELLELIVSNIVKDEKFEIEKEETDKDIHFKVTSTRIGVSRLVGRKGLVADSIRNVIRALKDEDKRIYVDFVNFDENNADNN